VTEEANLGQQAAGAIAFDPVQCFDAAPHRLARLAPAQARCLSPITLAYVGDAVYELFMRLAYLLPPGRLGDYHQKVVAQVRAESQANCLQFLDPYLTDIEKDLLRRGRNAGGKSPRNLNPAIYQQATALETLIGYLYLTNTQRLQEILHHMQAYLRQEQEDVTRHTSL
jgi:ribonuclease-3 family protein